jgi:hypothetical protein
LPPGGQTVTFRKTFSLDSAPSRAACVITVDNQYTLYVNGKKVQADDNWETVEAENIAGALKKGENEIVIVAVNAGGNAPNPAAVYFEAIVQLDSEKQLTIASDKSWQWTAKAPDGRGKFKDDPADWQAAAVVSGPWGERLGGELKSRLAVAGDATRRMVRASLVKSDFFMRSLGRPNRDQIVSVRPNELTTLEAMDLSNGQTLADLLARGAQQLVAQEWKSPEAFVRWLYRSALSREPSPKELAALRASLGERLTQQGIEDAMWAVIMLPEFQLVR